MKIEARRKDGVIILDLEGNIDINASDFVEAVGWALINRTKNILCNFAQVNLVDYVGISVIAVVYKNVLNHKGKIKIYNVPSHVRKLFSIVGLDRVLDIYEIEEQALQSFKEEKIFSQILKKNLRRRFKRAQLRTTIEYKQKFSSKGFLYKGKILNLSGDGIFVVVQKVFSIGELLTSKIYLLPNPGLIETDVKVVWVADREIQPLESPGMGLEFHNLTHQKQEKIMEFVEKHLTHNFRE